MAERLTTSGGNVAGGGGGGGGRRGIIKRDGLASRPGGSSNTPRHT